MITSDTLTDVLQQLLHRSTLPAAPEDLWNAEDHRHQQHRRRHPLVVRLVDSLLVFLLRADAKVDQIRSHRAVEVLADDVASLDPAPRLDLFRVLDVGDVRLALDRLAKRSTAM